MRITLIQPPQGTRFGFTQILMVEPLGLECASAAVRLHQHDTHLFDLRLDQPHEAGRAPQVVASSAGAF